MFGAQVHGVRRIMTSAPPNYGFDVPGLLDAAAAQGIKFGFVRDEGYWGRWERGSKGNRIFTGPVNNFEEIYGHYASRGLQLLLTLNWSNSLYQPDMADYGGGVGWAAYNSETLAAFVTGFIWFVREIRSRWPRLLCGIEVWNEGNGTWNGYPKVDGSTDTSKNNKLEQAQRFVALTTAVWNGFRATSEFDDLPILGGALINVPQIYIKNLCDEGLLSVCDGLAFHPYGAIDAKPFELQELRKTLTNAGKPNFPLWCTEIGGPPSVSDPLLIAQYLAQMLPIMRAFGVTRASWYHSRDLKSRNSAGVVTETESPRGLMEDIAPYAIKAPGETWRAYAELVGRATYLGNLAGNPTTTLYKFRAADNSIFHACRGSNAAIKVTGSHTAKDYRGNSITAASTYTLTSAPIYLFGNVSVVEDFGNDKFFRSTRAFNLEQDVDNLHYIIVVGYKTIAEPTVTADTVGEVWRDPSSAARISVDTLWPGRRGNVPTWAGVRLTIPSSGLTGYARLKAKIFFQGGGGALPEVRDFIYRINGQPYYGRAGTTGTTQYNATIVVPLVPGDKHDVILGPGPGSPPSVNYDNTRYAVLWTLTNDAITAPDVVGEIQLADRTQDFSGTQGANGWRYKGYRTPGVVEDLTWDAANSRWARSGTSSAGFMAAGSIRPGYIPTATPWYSVAEWTPEAPISSPRVKIVGTFDKSAGGAGMSLKLARVHSDGTFDNLWGLDPLTSGDAFTQTIVTDWNPGDKLWAVYWPGSDRSVDTAFDDLVNNIQVFTTEAALTTQTANIEEILFDPAIAFTLGTDGAEKFLYRVGSVEAAMVAGSTAWGGANVAGLSAAATQLSPGVTSSGHATPNQAATIIGEWTVAADGRISIVGTVKKAQTGSNDDGINVSIVRVRGGTRLVQWHRLLTDTTTENISLVMDVQAGDKIRREVDCGPGTNRNFDTSVWSVGYYATYKTATAPDV